MRAATVQGDRFIVTRLKLHTTFSRRDVLRRSTAAAHTRIDGVLSGGLASALDYAAYLRGMQRFVVESAAALADDGSYGELVGHRQRLDVDLSRLHAAALPPTPTAALHDLPGRLGWQYVVAGASLGARFLLRDARALGFDGATGAAFLAHHAGGDDWAGFLRRLDAAPLHETDYPRLCASAGHAFDAAHAAMLAARQEVTA